MPSYNVIKQFANKKIVLLKRVKSKKKSKKNPKSTHERSPQGRDPERVSSTSTRSNHKLPALTQDKSNPSTMGEPSASALLTLKKREIASRNKNLSSKCEASSSVQENFLSLPPFLLNSAEVNDEAIKRAVASSDTDLRMKGYLRMLGSAGVLDCCTAPKEPAVCARRQPKKYPPRPDIRGSFSFNDRDLCRYFEGYRDSGQVPRDDHPRKERRNAPCCINCCCCNEMVSPCAGARFLPVTNFEIPTRRKRGRSKRKKTNNNNRKSNSNCLCTVGTQSPPLTEMHRVTFSQRPCENRARNFFSQFQMLISPCSSRSSWDSSDVSSILLKEDEGDDLDDDDDDDDDGDENEDDNDECYRKKISNINEHGVRFNDAVDEAICDDDNDDDDDDNDGDDDEDDSGEELLIMRTDCAKSSLKKPSFSSSRNDDSSRKCKRIQFKDCNEASSPTKEFWKRVQTSAASSETSKPAIDRGGSDVQLSTEKADVISREIVVELENRKCNGIDIDITIEDDLDSGTTKKSTKEKNRSNHSTPKEKVEAVPRSEQTPASGSDAVGDKKKKKEKEKEKEKDREREAEDKTELSEDHIKCLLDSWATLSRGKCATETVRSMSEGSDAVDVYMEVETTESNVNRVLTADTTEDSTQTDVQARQSESSVNLVKSPKTVRRLRARTSSFADSRLVRLKNVGKGPNGPLKSIFTPKSKKKSSDSSSNNNRRNLSKYFSSLTRHFTGVKELSAEPDKPRLISMKRLPEMNDPDSHNKSQNNSHVNSDASTAGNISRNCGNDKLKSHDFMFMRPCSDSKRDQVLSAFHLFMSEYYQNKTGKRDPSRKTSIGAESNSTTQSSRRLQNDGLDRQNKARSDFAYRDSIPTIGPGTDSRSASQSNQCLPPKRSDATCRSSSSSAMDDNSFLELRIAATMAENVKSLAVDQLRKFFEDPDSQWNKNLREYFNKAANILDFFQDCVRGSNSNERRKSLDDLSSSPENRRPCQTSGGLEPDLPPFLVVQSQPLEKECKFVSPERVSALSEAYDAQRCPDVDAARFPLRQKSVSPLVVGGANAASNCQGSHSPHLVSSRQFPDYAPQPPPTVCRSPYSCFYRNDCMNWLGRDYHSNCYRTSRR